MQSDDVNPVIQSLQNELSLLFQQLSEMVNELTRKVDEFSLTQADHFEGVRRCIDIHREILLQEAKSTSESMVAHSLLMIKQVEEHEQAFRTNFNQHIRPYLTGLGLELEKPRWLHLTEKSDLASITNLKLDLADKLYDVKRKLAGFRLFEYDLKRNRFEEDTGSETFIKYFGPWSERIDESKILSSEVQYSENKSIFRY